MHYYLPLLTARERFRKACREILVFGAVGWIALAIALHDPGWKTADLFTGLLLFCIPIGLPLWLVYRFTRFVIGR